MNFFKLILMLLALYGSSSLKAQSPTIPDPFVNPESISETLNAENTSYKVPEGKNFYITHVEIEASSRFGDNGMLSIDQNDFFTFGSGNRKCGTTDYQLSIPLMVSSGQEIAVKVDKGGIAISGFLLSGETQSILINSGESFTVPEGKIFVLLHEVSLKKCNIPYKGYFEYSHFDFHDAHFPQFYAAGKNIRDFVEKELPILGYLMDVK